MMVFETYTMEQLINKMRYHADQQNDYDSMSVKDIEMNEIVLTAAIEEFESRKGNKRRLTARTGVLDM